MNGQIVIPLTVGGTVSKIPKMTQGTDGKTFTFTMVDSQNNGIAITGTLTASYFREDEIYAVDGALTPDADQVTNAGVFTWKPTAIDTQYPGEWALVFLETVSGENIYSFGGRWVIESNPFWTGSPATPAAPLVGVSVANAAWLTVSAAGGALGTAAYAATGDFDAAGAAAAAQAASVQKTGDTMSGPLIIDATNAEALHVRKASDGGDIFRVDTTNGLVSVGAIAAPTELFEVRGAIPDYNVDTFGIRATVSIDPPIADTTYHWSAMLAQAVIPSGNTVQAGAWSAAMYTYYKQDGAGAQADGRSIAAIARINDGTITKLATIQTDNQLTGDAIAGNVYHLYCKPTVKSDSSQVTGNEYALYVGNMTAGVKNYAVYVDGANVECYLRDTTFAGDVTLDSGGRLLIDPGTNASPGLHFNNDVDLGLYRQGSNNLGIACGGQNVAEFKALQIGFGTVRGGVTPAAALHVDNWTAAQPVLLLDQADVSEEIIEIVSTAGVGNAIELVGAKSLTVTEFIKVTINGNTRYIAAGTIA